jgi:hypothetical protein
MRKALAIGAVLLMVALAGSAYAAVPNVMGFYKTPWNQPTQVLVNIPGPGGLLGDVRVYAHITAQSGSLFSGHVGVVVGDFVPTSDDVDNESSVNNDKFFFKARFAGYLDNALGIHIVAVNKYLLTPPPVSGLVAQDLLSGDTQLIADGTFRGGSGLQTNTGPTMTFGFFRGITYTLYDAGSGGSVPFAGGFFAIQRVSD